MDAQSLLIIAVVSIFITNFVFSRFLGTCPYIGVSKSLDSAIGMGLAVVFVMTLASMATWLIYKFMLEPTSSNIFYRLFSLENPPNLLYLRTITFILVIAVLVQFVEMVIQKTSPGLYQALGIYLPLITTNCAVLAVAILNVESNYNFIESVFNGFTSGIGFTLALILMAGIRERLDLAPIPKALKGVPIAFIMAGLMAIAFLGFAGMKL